MVTSGIERSVGHNGLVSEQLPTRTNPLSLAPTGVTPLPSAPAGATMYERIGGHDAFAQLVAEFYRGVADDAELRALYPEPDLGPAADRLRMFLEQYWGGPHTYHELRGHPRLRIRHAPFAVTPSQRDRWLTHMRAALDTLALASDDDAEMWAYFSSAAQFLVNADD